MDKENIRKQVEYIVAKGWNPAIEHTEPENAFDHYWYMWKLPMFGETDVDTILAEADACQKQIRTTMCDWSATTTMPSHKAQPW